MADDSEILQRLQQLRRAAVAFEVTPEPESEAKIDLEQARGRSELADAEQNREERKKYANRSFWLSALWLAAVLLVVVASGFGSEVFEVSEAVLTTLAVSTTGTVFGIVYIIMRHLFPDRFQGPKQ